MYRYDFETNSFGASKADWSVDCIAHTEQRKKRRQKDVQIARRKCACITKSNAEI